MANKVKQEVNVQAEVSGKQQVKALTDAFKELFDQLNKLQSISLDDIGKGLNDASIALGKVKTAFNDFNYGLDAISQGNKLIDKSIIDDAEKKLDDFRKTYIDTISSTIEEANDIYGEFLRNTSSPFNPENLQDNINVEQVAQQLDNTSDSTVNLTQLFSQLTKQAGLTNSSMDGLLKTLGASAGEIAIAGAALAGLIAAFKETYKVTEQVTNKIKDIGIDIGKFVGELGIGSVDLFVDSLIMLGDAFEDLSSFCSDAIDKLQDFADIGSEVQSSYFRIYQYLGAGAGQDMINYTDSISNLFNLDGTALLKSMKGILAVTSQLGQDQAGVVKYTKALQQLSLDLSAFSGDSVENISQQFENAINMSVLNSRSSIAKAFNLTDSDIKQFKELNTEIERTNFLLLKEQGIQGTYAAYMDTAAGKVMQLKNAYSNLMNTVGKLALAIYSAVAPVLTKIINLVNWALQGLAKLLNIDLSSPLSNGAADLAGKYADNIGKVGDNLEKTGKQAEKASKKVASFDDVIQIDDSKNKESSLGDMLGDIQNYDPASWLGGLGDAVEDDVFSIDKLKEKIQELLDDFKAWEEAIKWDEWRQKAADFGKVLAELANIIVDDEQAWKDLGDLIGNSINVALEFLNAFAKEFHFEQLGKDIAVALKEIFDDLDEDLAAETIYNWIVGVLSTGIGFFKERPLTSASDSISTIIANLFNNLSSLDATIKINEFLDNLFGDVLGAINTSLDNFENNNTGNRFASVISNIFVNIGEHTPEIIETVSRVLQFLLDTLGSTISQSIDGFFTGLESEEGGTDTIVNSLIGIVDSIFSNLGKIGEALSKHKDTITKLITDFINGLVDNAEDWGVDIQPLVDSLIEIIKSIDTSKIGDAIRTLLKNANIGELVSEVVGLELRTKWEIFKTNFGIAWDGFWNNVGEGLKTIGAFLLLTLTILLRDALAVMTLGGSELALYIMRHWDEIKTKASEFGKSIKEKITSLSTWMWNTGTNIWNNVTRIFNNIKNTISSVIESIKTIVKNGINFIIDKLNGLHFKIPDWLSNVPLAGNFAGKEFGFNIPRLAIGGIVNNPTHAVIGEDGKEAVLPLQKNTEWMDALASRLANQINNGAGNNGNTVNIQLSNKNFYTRAEMLDFAEQVVTALRVYGVNVSVAY